MFREYNNSPDAKLATLIRRTINPRYGIFRSIAEMPVHPDGPPMFIARTMMVNPMHFRLTEPVRNHLSGSSGAGLTRTECCWATIGEGLERYSASIYYDDQLVTASAIELGSLAVDVEKFVLYSDGQYQDSTFPFKSFDPGLTRRWATGRNLDTGATVLVPAQMVWLGYSLKADHEYLVQNLSTGLGASDTLDGAIFTGLREVLERDAFMSHWLLREPGMRIRLSDGQLNIFPAGFSALLDGTHGLVTIRLLPNEFDVPVVLAIVQDRHSEGISVGAACHPVIWIAIYKAVVEAWHTRYWGIDLRLLNPSKVSASEVSSFEDHVRFYREEENVSKIAFMLSGDGEVIDLAWTPSIDIVQATRSMIDKITTRGHDVIAVDVTSSDVSDLGLRVARVLVPGLQPLYCGTQFMSHDRKRIDVVARNIGCQEASSLNLDPHPFP